MVRTKEKTSSEKEKEMIDKMKNFFKKKTETTKPSPGAKKFPAPSDTKAPIKRTAKKAK